MWVGPNAGRAPGSPADPTRAALSPIACDPGLVTGDEGLDGTQVAYSERLWAPVWVWLLVPALVSVVAIAYGSAYGTAIGAVGLIAGSLAGWLALIAWCPVIRVDDRVLRAGRARLPLRYVGDVQTLMGPAFREELRAGDARSFVVLRPWAMRSGVVVAVTDDADPHPRWLVASRRPGTLAEALAAARAQQARVDRAE